MSPKVLVASFIVLFLGVFLFIVNLNIKQSQTPLIDVQQTPTLSASAAVPPLNEEDTIKIFFELINGKMIPEAISMMSLDTAPDESAKQLWGVQFDAFTSVRVIDLEPYQKEAWTKNLHTYKVFLETRMSENSINAPIPYFGYDSGSNVRWITVEKNNEGAWKIDGISTGP